MSATDYGVCPMCKKKAIEYIDKWYGKVTKEQWSALLDYRTAWDREDEDWESQKEIEDLIDKIEEKFEGDFERSEFSIDESITTLRYDKDTCITDEGTLSMSEEYICDCGFEIIVKKEWLPGTNQEKK